MGNWATKESIFKCPVPKEKYSIPGIGDIWIHGLTIGEKDIYENEVVIVKSGDQRIEMENARAVLIQRTVYDQHGNLLFAAKDIGRINQIAAEIIEPVYQIARRLSGMLASKKEYDDTAKNSEMPGTGDSIID